MTILLSTIAELLRFRKSLHPLCLPLLLLQVLFPFAAFEESSSAPEGSFRNPNRWSLSGKNAPITGGTRGIGHAVVEELADLGARVHLCSRKEEELNKCLKEWQTKGFSVTGSVYDVSCRDQRQKLIVSSVFSGTNFRKVTVDYTTEDFAQIMSTNFDPAYHLCQLAHPLLKNSGSGSVIFIFSVASFLSLGTGSVYAASKVF